MTRASEAQLVTISVLEPPPRLANLAPVRMNRIDSKITLNSVVEWVFAHFKLSDLFMGQKTFCGFSVGSNQNWAGRVYDLCVYYMTGAPEGSPKVVLWRSRESNLRPLVYKTYNVGLSTVASPFLWDIGKHCKTSVVWSASTLFAYRIFF